MKVSKAQAQANRAHIVETAAALFRERGYDGVGVAELMAAAGFTHGGFYKHFPSKSDLMAEATACGLAQAAAVTCEDGVAAAITQYLSREHRDQRDLGCPMAALSGDAARQDKPVRAVFADGIEQLLTCWTGAKATRPLSRAEALDVMAHLVGALVLSRACPDDSPLADEILQVSRATLLAAVQPAAQAEASAETSAVLPAQASTDSVPPAPTAG